MIFPAILLGLAAAQDCAVITDPATQTACQMDAAASAAEAINAEPVDAEAPPAEGAMAVDAEAEDAGPDEEVIRNMLRQEMLTASNSLHICALGNLRRFATNHVDTPTEIAAGAVDACVPEYQAWISADGIYSWRLGLSDNETRQRQEDMRTLRIRALAAQLIAWRADIGR